MNEPRTEAGRGLIEDDMAADASRWVQTPWGLARRVVRIENEARADLLTTLEAEVGGLDFMVPRGCSCHEGQMRRAYEPDEYRAAFSALLAKHREEPR